MIITEGSIADLVAELDFIRKKIPQKSGLSKNDIYARLQDKPYGIVFASSDDAKGVTVWYEEEESLYLWLGAVSKSGTGLGRMMNSYIQEKTNYLRWFVKTAHDNEVALALLTRSGFNTYDQKGKVVFLQRFLR